MTNESKKKILAAFDALVGVQSGMPASSTGRHNSHGGSARCDICGHSLAEGTPHEQQIVKLTTFDGEPTPGYCPIGIAMAALNRLVPPFGKRGAWLGVFECAADCSCFMDCGSDSHSGTWHQHEGDPCPVHPNAPTVG